MSVARRVGGTGDSVRSSSTSVYDSDFSFIPPPQTNTNQGLALLKAINTGVLNGIEEYTIPPHALAR